ncbi:MAG TPA: T9SS type A sorting domain-containing protein, partial [Bacteroidia bacterium]|nr:T9SS type A sorting domain-containing protein [Bacteroidia bacterium]
DHTSGVEYWTLSLLSSNSPTEQCFVTLTSNNPAQSQISDLTDLCVAHDDVGVTGLWEDMGPDLSAGAIGASVSAESATEFIDYSPITWGSKHGTNALPIQLTSFTADCNNYQALLQWTTATELNNDHFTIERTQDGVNYEPVTEIKGAGTSTTPRSYSYTDESPLTGTSYYRISQTDMDGKITHLSTIVYVPCQDENDINSFVYNNTIKAEINSVESGPYAIALYNMLGQEVFTKNVNASVGLNNYTLNPGASSGVYILHITGKNSVYTKKMVFGN